ncbi:hypothetical protein GCM10023191_040300 [Actinoallomurus oryzae]|jgi:hypothetical protein|uniref:Methylamine utilisation protein MauE domain-containing protein n=1 Tax=Actinoallomurus oryzae TaxID=502180 RepID=A0ABP8Q6M9_9ACTN
MSATDLALFARILIGLTFAATVVGKLRDPASFGDAVDDFKIFVRRAVRPVATTLIVAEAAVCVLVALPGPGPVAGLGLAGVLLLAYTAALGTVLARRMTLGCNCFGASPRVVSRHDIARNVLLLCGAIGGLVAYVLAGPHHAYDAARLTLLAGTATAATLLLANFADVVETVRKPMSAE